MKMKKLLMGVIALTCCGIVSAQSLTTFTDITQQLANGNDISLTIDLSTCKVDDPNQIKMPLSKWFVKPDAALFTDTIVSIGGEKYAHGRPPLPENGLLQRASLLIDNKGTVQVVVSFFDAETNKKWMKDVNAQCQLNNGVRVFSHSQS
jgi:hypothetical protein